MKKIICTLAVLAAIGSSCKKTKDDPSPTSNKSTAELLSDHTWKLESSKADKSVDTDGDGNSSDNVYDQNESCRNDDIINFTNSSDENKTGAVDAGSSKCNNDPQTKPFTWKVLTENTIEITGWFYYKQFTIDKFSIGNNKMTVYFSTKDKNNLEYIQTDVYVKP